MPPDILLRLGTDRCYWDIFTTLIIVYDYAAQVGDSWMQGGLFMLKDGKVVWSKPEHYPGDFPDEKVAPLL